LHIIFRPGVLVLGISSNSFSSSSVQLYEILNIHFITSRFPFFQMHPVVFFPSITSNRLPYHAHTPQLVNTVPQSTSVLYDV